MEAVLGVRIKLPPEAIIPLAIGVAALLVLLFAGSKLADWKARSPVAAARFGLIAAGAHLLADRREVGNGARHAVTGAGKHAARRGEHRGVTGEVDQRAQPRAARRVGNARGEEFVELGHGLALEDVEQRLLVGGIAALAAVAGGGRLLEQQRFGPDAAAARQRVATAVQAARERWLLL